MHKTFSRKQQHFAVYCSLCGREIISGEEYWFCNGTHICPDCLSAFARTELAPCHKIHGKESCYDII